MKREDRVITGLAMAPLAPISLIIIIAVLLEGRSSVRVMIDWLPRALPWFAAFAYPTELLVGLPAHRAMSRRGVDGVVAYCLLGGLTGATPFTVGALIVLLASARNGRFDNDVLFWLTWAVIGMAYGVISAIAFWLIAVRPAGVKHG
jgi:hypothetical protein